MRVTGVSLFSYPKNRNEENSVEFLRRNQFIKFSNVSKDKFIHNPYFGANYISSYMQYRLLAKDYDIHCIYCRKLMVYGGTLKDMLKEGVFSSPISEFTQRVRPFRKYMKTGQKRVFDQIDKYAKKSPQTHLSEIIQFLYQNAIVRLAKMQTGIFKTLIEESKELPKEMQESFRKFMRIQHKRLYEIPYKEEFNAEKFAYKIRKMIQPIPNEELKTYLTRITAPMYNPVFTDKNNTVPYELASQITHSKLGKLTTVKDYSEYVIKRVRKIGERLDMQNIVRVCQSAQRMIENQPVVVPFSNREFMEELVKVHLKGISKTPLYYRMVSIARKLPNSKSNKNSFVVKHRYSNSDTIGYKLLEPSIVTIEHVKARYTGGVEDLTNCVLACKEDNNDRGYTEMYKYIKKKNFNKKNPQRFFDDIIEISNREHLVRPSDIEGMSQSVITEGHVKINTTKLKR